MQVSHIISLYTKSDVIPHTLRSVMEQEGDFQRELILVDDNSKDDTVEVARRVTSNFSTTVITNSNNKGPSVRLNQGAKLAKGKYLHFLDHDDILPANATKVMYDILEKTGADFIYGRWEITSKTPQELIGTKTDEKASYKISNNPLDTILNGKFKRMCILVRRDVFEKAGGFDENIFIQDENLPLRLALVAKNMVVFDGVVNLVPKGEGNLSDNKSQLNHDRFLAYYNIYNKCKDFRVYKRAISAVWKQKRQSKCPLKFCSWQFINYITAFAIKKPSAKTLQKSKAYFDYIEGVLKP